MASSCTYCNVVFNSRELKSPSLDEKPSTTNSDFGPVHGVEKNRAFGQSDLRRGLTCGEAAKYLSVKRRIFEDEWRPYLRSIRQGTSLIFDRAEIDRLFDLKLDQSQAPTIPRPISHTKGCAANDAVLEKREPKLGNLKWAKNQLESTGTLKQSKVPTGKSTNGIAARGFEAVASAALMKRKTGSIAKSKSSVTSDCMVKGHAARLSRQQSST